MQQILNVSIKDTVQDTNLNLIQTNPNPFVKRNPEIAMEPLEIAIIGGAGFLAAEAFNSLMKSTKPLDTNEAGGTDKSCAVNDAFRDFTKNGLVCMVQAFDKTKEAIDEANQNFQSLLDEARNEAEKSKNSSAPRQVDITAD